MKIETTKADVIWSYVGRIFAYTNNLILLPIIMFFLSGEELGLWYIFLSIGSLVNLFTFGFNPTFCRNIAYAWSGVRRLNTFGRPENIDTNGEGANWELFHGVVKASKWIYLAISLLALFVLIVLGTPYIVYISNGVSLKVLLVSWLFYCLSVFFTLFFGYYEALLLGTGKVSLSQKASIYSKVFQLIFTLLLLLTGFGILAVSFAAFFSSLVYRLLLKRYFSNSVKQYGINVNQWGRPSESFPLLKKFWPNTWRDGIVHISSYLSTQASTLICSMFFSLEMTGVYSICTQIANAIVAFAQALYGSMQPSVQSAIAVNDEIKLKKLYSISIVFFWTISILGTLAFIFIGVPVLNLIKPEYNFSSLFCFILMFYYMLFQHQRLNASFLSNFNILPYVKSFIVSSALGLLFAYISMSLFSGYELYALVLSQILVQSLYNNWKWPLVVCKVLGVRYFQVILNGISILRQKFKMVFNCKIN